MKDFSSPTIIEYLGKVGNSNSILTLISLSYINVYYECIFVYNETDYMFNISSELSEILEGPIEEHPQYLDLMKEIYKKVIPYKELVNSLDNFDINKWFVDTVKSTESKSGLKINIEDIKKEDT